MTAPKWEWRVQYRRRGWPHVVPRFYQSLPAARRLVAKLRSRSWDWDHLQPIVELHVQRREVSEWEDVTPAELIDVYHGAEG